ncbi:MAG: rhomboid family intramembrane serine protease [Pseudomonadota bacterium]
MLFVAWGLILACVAVEAVLIAAEAGFLGSARWRSLAYQNGGFWAGLLGDWRPNFAAQPVTMFVTHAFLHGSLTHLAGNMVTLHLLGAEIRSWTGAVGFSLIYAVSVLGGALGFAALNDSPAPMVGASGALFGLVGALLVWDWGERRRMGRPSWRVLGLLSVALVALNFAMWVWLEGVLAWEAHLGGFLAGALLALAWPPLAAPPPPEGKEAG